MTVPPEVVDASLSIYLSTDTGRDPARRSACDWRDGRTCQSAGTVLVHLSEADDGVGQVFCPGHAVVEIDAAVTRLRKRFVLMEMVKGQKR